MSERGVIAIDRGVFDHECFADEPFTEREAWMWLISEAAWKPRARRIVNQVVHLERGQLVASLRFMGQRWKWSKDKVARFLDRLVMCDMIATETETGINVITIIKYNTYQRVSLPNETQSETETATAARQQRDKREDIEKILEAKASSAEPVYTDSKHELWGEGIPILISLGLSERAARSNVGRWLKAAKDDAQAVLGAIQRARDHRVIDPIPWITRAISSKGQENVTENRSVVAAARRAAENLRGATGVGDAPSEPVLRLVSES